MVTFLFWNLNKKPRQEIVARLAHRHEVDVVMLAECAIAPATMLQTLNPRGTGAYHLAPGECAKVVVYTRFDSSFIRPVHEEHRFTIRALELPARTDILLAVTHLRSALYQRADSQAFGCVEFGRTVRDVEERQQHQRTVVVGDLNVNPFEAGVVGASGLHGVMTREIAKRGSRTVESRKYPFFYNPMWGCLGDGTRGPPGTYYYPGSEHVTFFWNVFDQVLLRPELLGRFRNEDLAILTEDGTTSFLSQRGMPDASIASDHLPVLFKLDL